MKTPDQYREFAAECYRLAAEARTEEQEKILREIAQAWREMAEEAETKSPWSVQELPALSRNRPMNDQLANAIKAKLDKELAGTEPNVGIRFELDLFRAFKDRGWITLDSFGPLGAIFGGTKLPAYDTHLAIATWDLPKNGYELG